jgi:hypothetical protein
MNTGTQFSGSVNIFQVVCISLRAFRLKDGMLAQL